MKWADTEYAGQAWPEGKRLGDERLEQLLDVAQEQLEAYAPRVVAGSPVPERYREAVVLQARDLASAAQRDGSSDVIGFEAYAVRARPLSAVVRSLLRPARGVGAVG